MKSPPESVVSVGACASTGVEIQICYSAFGDRKNPCVLLVMGLGASGLSWMNAFCEGIANAGFYVIRYDNRDVGLSTHLTNFPPPNILRMIIPSWASLGEKVPYTLEDMAADGMNLLTKLNITKAHVLGCSMGGMIVQIMATQYPTRVLSLNIFFSHTGSPQRVAESLSTKLWFLDKPASAAEEDVLDFKYRFIERITGPNYPVDKKLFCEFAKEMEKRAPDDANGKLRQVAAITRGKSRAAALKDLKKPTLIIHGMVDPLIPYQNGIQIAEIVGKSAKLVLFPRMSHYLVPDLFPEYVEEIVRNCKRAENAN